MISKLRRETNSYLRNLLQHREYDTVLNLGCGSDSDKEGSSYSEYFRAREVLLMDPRPGAHPQLSAVARAEAIPLKSASVDLVFLNWVLVVGDPLVSVQIAAALKDVRRVLSPGGEVIISYADCSQARETIVLSTRKHLASRFLPTSVAPFAIANDHYLDRKVDWMAEIFVGGVP